jgi:DNA-binding protein
MTEYRTGNVVIIADKDIEKYVYSILMRMNPEVYNREEHGCIIIKTIDAQRDFVDNLLVKMRWAGIKVVSKERKTLINEKSGKEYYDAWEIVLKKIPVLEMQEEKDG